jgi:hypothetical protein
MDFVRSSFRLPPDDSERNRGVGSDSLLAVGLMPAFL